MSKSNIRSPLGDHSFQSNDQQQRVLKVDDPTQQSMHPSYSMGQPQEQPYNRKVLPSQANRQMQNPADFPELTEEQIEDLKRQRKAHAAQQAAVPRNVRERVEYLTGIGRIRDSIEVEDESGRMVKFDLQSLKDGELEDVSEIMVAFRNSTPTKASMELRRQILARSLWAIDGIKVRDLIGSDDVNDKVALIRDLDENLVTLLQSFYEEKIMKVGREKYTVKSKEDMEQLSEEIKK